MAQTAYPVSLVSNTGWVFSSGSNGWDLIDEVVPDHADYVQALWSGAAKALEVGLTSLSQPGAGTGSFSFWAFMSTAGPFVENQDLTVALYDGATLIKTSTTEIGVVGTTPTETVVNLSSGEVASVTDWSDVRAVFEPVDGDLGAVIRVSQFSLSVPNAASSSGGFTLTNQTLGNMRMLLRDRPDRYGNGMTREFQRYFRDNPVVRTDVFQYDEPLSSSDAESGRICTESGYWFPGRRVVYVDGRPYGDIFAPETYLRQLKGPSAWDFE